MMNMNPVLAIVAFVCAIPMVTLFLYFVAVMVCDAIAEYNIRKYNCWWGHLPMWASDIVWNFMTH